MTNYLKFVNQDAVPKETEIALHSKDGAEEIMTWYGSHYAGDDYEVFLDGDKLDIDQNGELRPLVIEGAVFVCDLPRPLGAVTNFKPQGKKLVAETESGIPFIVPLTHGEPSDVS